MNGVAYMDTQRPQQASEKSDAQAISDFPQEAINERFLRMNKGKWTVIIAIAVAVIAVAALVFVLARAQGCTGIYPSHPTSNKNFSHSASFSLAPSEGSFNTGIEGVVFVHSPVNEVRQATMMATFELDEGTKSLITLIFPFGMKVESIESDYSQGLIQQKSGNLNPHVTYGVTGNSNEFGQYWEETVVMIGYQAGSEESWEGGTGSLLINLKIDERKLQEADGSITIGVQGQDQAATASKVLYFDPLKADSPIRSVDEFYRAYMPISKDELISQIDNQIDAYRSENQRLESKESPNEQDLVDVENTARIMEQLKQLRKEARSLDEQDYEGLYIVNGKLPELTGFPR
jgi:hypothetical protein